MALDPPTPTVDLPSLNALRAFEVAARVGGFRRASAVLSISAAAVAQHVKAVEAWAGRELFDRSPQGVMLNEAGRSALPLLTTGFAQIGDATRRLRAHGDSRPPFRIAALPALAQLWVAPRVAELRKVLDDVEVSVHAVESAPDVLHGPYDAQLFYGPLETVSDVVIRADGPGDQLVLVAARDLQIDRSAPEVMEEVILLCDVSWPDHWEKWAVGAGVVDGPRRVTSFTLFSMALDAAIRGDGVLVAPRSLVGPYLDSGALVEPFDVRVGSGMQLTWLMRSVEARIVDPVMSWARRELART